MLHLAPADRHFVANRLARAARLVTLQPMSTPTLLITPLTPLIAVHLSAALAALALGPIVLWARKGAVQRPRLHRAFGYAWVTLMVATAISAFFIRDPRPPNVAGFTPIHLFIPFTLYGLVRAFQALARGDIASHRKRMVGLYVGACIVAGAFTLLPSRFLGQLVWHQWLGWI